MQRVRITGLVAMANRVRRLLSEPVSARDLARLRQTVTQGLRTVDQILAESHARAEDLPPQSRKAYRFLKEIDFDRVPVTGPDARPSPHVGNVRFPGLRRFLESVLEALANAGRESVEPVKSRIVSSSRRLEEQIAGAGLQAKHLTSETRQIRGWLASSPTRRIWTPISVQQRLHGRCSNRPSRLPAAIPCRQPSSSGR